MTDHLESKFTGLLLDVLNTAREDAYKSIATLNHDEVKQAKDLLQKINHLLNEQERNLQTSVNTHQNYTFRFSDAATTSLTSSHSTIHSLNNREKEILQLMAEGLSNKAISECLDLKISTIKWYSTSIFEKLSVTNRTQAAKVARELNLENS